MSHIIQYGITAFEELEFHREHVGTLILRYHRLDAIRIIGFDPNWLRLGT
jgi:hypothetical protein